MTFPSLKCNNKDTILEYNYCIGMLLEACFVLFCIIHIIYYIVGQEPSRSEISFEGMYA